MLKFRNLPDLTKSQHQLLESCYTSVFLVESPTAHEIFMVKWYRKFCNHLSRTKAIMVFKIEKGNAIYTEDIGELCMFLSDTDVLCESANASFALSKDNQVKIDEVGEGPYYVNHNLARGPIVRWSK